MLRETETEKFAFQSCSVPLLKLSSSWRLYPLLPSVYRKQNGEHRSQKTWCLTFSLIIRYPARTWCSGQLFSWPIVILPPLTRFHPDFSVSFAIVMNLACKIRNVRINSASYSLPTPNDRGSEFHPLLGFRHCITDLYSTSSSSSGQLQLRISDSPAPPLHTTTIAPHCQQHCFLQKQIRTFLSSNISNNFLLHIK